MSRIVITTGILAGKPVIKGTRVSVEHIMELLASGMTIDSILEGYPQLKREDILDALAYATQRLRNESVYSITA